MCEEEAKKHIGRPQILIVLKLISKFLDENPLSCCSDEISSLRSMLGPDVSFYILANIEKWGQIELDCQYFFFSFFH